MDMIGKRMEQMIHDIHVRPAMIEMGKVLRDPRVKNAVLRQARLGEHGWDQIESFMNDFINNRNIRSAALRDTENLFAKLRQNIVNLVVATPSVALKHGPTAWFGSMGQVGGLKFHKAFVDMYRTDPLTMSKNLAIIDEESNECAGRMNNFVDILRGHGVGLKFEEGTWERARELFTYAGSFPVAWGDYLTVRPTFWAWRNNALAEGASHDLAIQIGDAAVRYAHGTSRLHGQAAIVRTGEFGKAWTTFYSIFSHLLQKHYEMAWKARDIFDAKMTNKTYAEMPKDIKEGMGRWVPHMAWMMFCYSIAPAIIEEMVSPTPVKEEDNFGWKMADGVMHFTAGMVPGVREWANALLYPNRRGGIMDVAGEMAGRLKRDIGKGWPQDAGSAARDIKDTMNLLALTTRFGNVALSNSVEYSIRVANGLESPEGIWDAIAGMRYGTAQKHGFDQWYEHVRPRIYITGGTPTF
jgi:hypothetical protein